MMIINRNRKGQTLIETALVLFLILLILLGITEFSRAWYTKNSLKNAVRQGARVAAVTPANNITTPFNCINPSCPLSDAVSNAVCCQPGIPRTPASNTQVSIECRDTSGAIIGCALISNNGTVKVSATSIFSFIIGNAPWPWQRNTTMNVDAAMRYE
jgi:hypothetical protein